MLGPAQTLLRMDMLAAIVCACCCSDSSAYGYACSHLKVLGAAQTLLHMDMAGPMINDGVLCT